ncbi:hypothetical protein HDU76_008845, partial [Blyttiomyces sp. JEL0837]
MGSSKTNVTLALILPYALIDYSISPIVNLFDSAAELAVNEVNKDDTLLPDIFIDMVRYNSRDPEHAHDFDLVPSGGGYAAVTAMKVASHNVFGWRTYGTVFATNVVLGALGEYGSKSAMTISGQTPAYQMYVWQIPFCGTIQGSVELSKKSIHPFYFRMTNGLGLGDYVLQFISHFNVKRIAMVSEISQDMIDALVRGGVKILTVLYLRESEFSTHDYALLYNALKDADARYILINHGLDETADFYYRSKAYGLMNPEHLWFGFNPPVPTSVDIATEYGPDVLNDFQGFVSFFPDIPYFTDPTIQAFNNSWAQMTEINSTKYPPLGFLDTLYAGATYDCVKTMAYGIHQLLEKNPSYTVEMLANGSLNHLLTPDKFANTGYRGVLYDPIMLNQYGDLYTPSLFFALNNSLWYDLPQDRTT